MEVVWRVRFDDLAGVKSSSQSSTPIQVSIVLMTASPNGTFVCELSKNGVEDKC